MLWNLVQVLFPLITAVFSIFSSANQVKLILDLEIRRNYLACIQKALIIKWCISRDFCHIKYLIYKMFVVFKCNLCLNIQNIENMQHIYYAYIFLPNRVVGQFSNLSCCKLLPHNQLNPCGRQLLFQRLQKILSSSLVLEVICLEVIFNFLVFFFSTNKHFKFILYSYRI